MYTFDMRIIPRKMLRAFWETHADARKVLEAWYLDTKRADWKTPSDIKQVYRNASFIANNRVVFNIKGNRYRVIVVVVYEKGVVYLRFVGTHSEYDKIDATTV